MKATKSASLLTSSHEQAHLKWIFLSALIGVGIEAAIFQISSGSEAARTPVDYPLVCRGGGTLVTGPAPGEGNLGFVFTRGTRPADEGLDPGQCSWKDRAIQAAEPDRVSQHVEEVVGAPKPLWYEELRYSDKYWTFMVSNNGKGQLIATSARSGGIDGSPTTTTTFTPSPVGLRTWFSYHQWHTDRWDCDPPRYKDDTSGVPAGQVLVGYINHKDGGHDPFPCVENSKIDYRGTIWFDLSEIFKESPFPIVAAKATLNFKQVEGSVAAYDYARRPISKVCEHRLLVATADWMKEDARSDVYGSDPRVPVPGGDLIAPIKGCPPEGCTIDVTSLVNNWITGATDRYGFVLAPLSEDEVFIDKLNPHDNSVCETRYGDFSLTVTYRFKRLIIHPLPPPEKVPGKTPPGPDTLDIRKNVALTSNGGTASASSTFNTSFSPGKAIDGEHQGLNWVSGGGWQGAGPTNDDWLQVDFRGHKTIDEIDVFMIQDNYASPIEPALDTPSTKYGLTNFRVQYWTQFGAWADVVVVGNPVTGNMNVWKQFKFRGLRTNKIRVLVSKTPDGWSRIAELEAWGQ